MSGKRARSENTPEDECSMKISSAMEALLDAKGQIRQLKVDQEKVKQGQKDLTEQTRKFDEDQKDLTEQTRKFDEDQKKSESKKTHSHGQSPGCVVTVGYSTFKHDGDIRRAQSTYGTFKLRQGQQLTIINNCMVVGDQVTEIVEDNNKNLVYPHPKEKEASRKFEEQCTKDKTQVCLVDNENQHPLWKKNGMVMGVMDKRFSKKCGLGVEKVNDVRFMVIRDLHGVYIQVCSVGTGRVVLQNPRVGVGGSADAPPPPVLLERRETRYLVEGSTLAFGSKKFTVKSVQMSCEEVKKCFNKFGAPQY